MMSYECCNYLLKIWWKRRGFGAGLLKCTQFGSKKPIGGLGGI